MSRISCNVCAHPMKATVDEICKSGEVEVEGKHFKSVSSLLDYMKLKHPDYPISNSNVTRHKQNGHIAITKVSKGKTDLAIVYRDGLLYQLQADGTEIEIPKREPREALSLLVAIGLHSALTGKTTVTVKDTVDALKKLVDIDKGAETVDQYHEAILEFLRSKNAKIVEQDQQPSSQDYLDQLHITPPEGLQDVAIVPEETDGGSNS